MKSDNRSDAIRWLRAAAATVVIGVFLGSTPGLYSQGARVSSPAELARIADELKPGEWVWAPSVAPTGPLLIYVDLSRQRATVYRNGVRIGVSTISSGKPGHETPTGVFTILQKDASHHSKKYDNAPMPFQQRLTWDGVALHAGGLPGYPESHGCVHLPYTFSQQLFGITTLGATVVVQGDDAHPRVNPSLRPSACA
jgi:lipoprotein-anchoring transpeptidase ErfK/SrfK